MLLTIIVQIITSFIFGFCLSYYLKKNNKYHDKYLLLFILICFMLQFISESFNDFYLGAFLLINLVGYIFAYYYTSNSFMEIVYILLFIQSMLLYGEIISMSLYRIISDNMFIYYEDAFFTNILILGGRLLSLVLVACLSNIKVYDSSTTSKAMGWLLLIYLVLFGITGYIYQDFLVTGNNLLIAFLLGTIFVFIYVLYNYLKQEHLEYMEMLMCIQESNHLNDYLKEFNKINEENRMIRHDIKNAMVAFKREEINVLEDYAYALPILSCDNMTINDIVNNKILHYKDLKIAWQFQIESDLKGIKKLDLGIILGNLLDNACENIGGNKQIKVSIKEAGKYYLINIENDVDTSVLLNNPNLLTDKKEKYYHGYGLKSINKIIQSYDGKVKYHEVKGKFSIEVYLRKD